MPPVPGERVLYLSRHDSLVVRGMDGVVDHQAWAHVRGAYPEFVPVGETRTFTLPEGARLEYKVGVADPWQ